LNQDVKKPPFKELASHIKTLKDLGSDLNSGDPFVQAEAVRLVNEAKAEEPRKVEAPSKKSNDLKALKGYKIRVDGQPIMRGVGICTMAVSIMGEEAGQAFLQTEGNVAGIVSPEIVRMYLFQLAAGCGEHFMEGLELFVGEIMETQEEEEEPPELTDVELEHARKTEEAAPDLFDADFPAVIPPAKKAEPSEPIETAEGSLGNVTAVDMANKPIKRRKKVV